MKKTYNLEKVKRKKILKQNTTLWERFKSIFSKTEKKRIDDKIDAIIRIQRKLAVAEFRRRHRSG